MRFNLKEPQGMKHGLEGVVLYNETPILIVVLCNTRTNYLGRN